MVQLGEAESTVSLSLTARGCSAGSPHKDCSWMGGGGVMVTRSRGASCISWRGAADSRVSVRWVSGSVTDSQAPHRHVHVKFVLLFPDSSWQWQSIDGAVVLPILPSSLRELTQQYDLCVTGEGLSHLQSVNRQQLLKLIPHIQVFARVVPKQKVRGFCWGKTQLWQVCQQGLPGAWEQHRY